MKKFQFKYEKILQLRYDKEDEIRNKLGNINKKIIDEEERLKELIRSQEEFLESISLEMEKGTTVGALKNIEHNKSYLKNAIDKCKKRLKLLFDERVKIQKDLIEANKERKVMEKLKEKELDNYKAMEQVEENKLVDQIVTYQSTRNRGDS